MRAAYRQWFQFGLENGGEENLRASLGEIGQDSARVTQAAAEKRTTESLAAETERAKALGIFGSPTFVVDGELFWGDDRLEDAISWLRERRVRRG